MLKIEIEGINYGSKNNIIEYLNITIAKFGMYKIEGNNGIGKTTLFKALNAEINYVSSSIQFMECDLNIAKTRDIVFIDDQFFGYLYLKPMEYLHYIAYLYKSEHSEQQMEAFLNLLDMNPYLTSLIKNLSQGNK